MTARGESVLILRMESRRKYIWQRPDWPAFSWQDNVLLKPASRAYERRGELRGLLAHAGFNDRQEAYLRAITDEVVENSKIEGEVIDAEAARSSIARRLRIPMALREQDAKTEGVVAMTLDAIRNFDRPLGAKRLFRWHADLFPFEFEHQDQRPVARWRTKNESPMRVVSGAAGHERIHFEALDTERVPSEMSRFLDWFNSGPAVDGIIKSATAHLWFLTIHPFFDGNGRIGRAVADMALARAEQTPERFYSLSAQIQRERKDYYAILEETQRGDLDITQWLVWFIDCYARSIESAFATAKDVMRAARFWTIHAGLKISDRQRDLLMRLLRGFGGNLTVKKWAKIMKRSDDAAYRDISDLVRKNLLVVKGGSKNTVYELARFK